ncbi:hypothetical protein NLG97_g10802 [Lecanicillium saksenae]|uniref:Uncharacterized protein n=1 Tax=Lecanicillium saksenae TaxID=468837 RepID=A0ACC1QC58_9HYPO|nr:hypothetical protein NLG97_g10802 [Lecanicillium saksenae]
MSPAKVGPHKKHLDAHGQTLLARACARGEYDGVKQRLEERPEDLNVADYAGNTPLQIAAINGCEDIVKLLIEAGCNLDCVNYDKDTPLLDAVDNGHLEVVKLLLDAGVNPRKANVNGEEPIDRVTDDTDHADEIKALLIAARKKAGDRTRTSEDRHSHHDFDARDSHAPDSPRRSPAAPSGRRSTTGRATKTRNDLLYMPLDDKTLRRAAGLGDEETVARILQVKEGFDDPESMVAAARGGHDLVIQLLLGLGGANADPGPVASLAAEFATPILAAIGQENIKVVQLLLEQQGFDPTRRFKGETYYEIARRRQGPNWKEEEDMLRAAYDEYKRTHKDGAVTKSPSRKEREREEKRAKREEARADAKRERKSLHSPAREAEPKRKISSKIDGQGSKRRSESFSTHGDEETPKRGPGRPRKEEKLSVVQGSDREASPNVQHKTAKVKRAESDAAAASSDGESVKPRRKLVSKGELRGEREKKVRVSSSGKEPTSPKASRNEETSEKQKLSEKYHDRTKALKRDPSKENDATSKRHRNSTTPDRSADTEKDESEVPLKRRRLENDATDKKSKRSALEDKTKKTNLKGGSDEDSVNDKKSKESKRRDSDRSASSDKVKIKSEDVDIAMTEAPLKEPSAEKADEADLAKKKEEEEAAKKEKKRLEEEEARREEEEKKAKEEEKEKKAKEEEKKKQKEEEEAARQREEEEKRKKEEEERKQREEEEPGGSGAQRARAPPPRRG